MKKINHCRMGALILSVFCASACYAGEYDYATAKAKLLQIGRALQLYRAEQTVKPVAERRTFRDCGLPATLVDLCRSGHEWSLPADKSTFKVATPLFKTAVINFHQMYWESDYVVQRVGAMTQFYAVRGERLPVLADFNMNSPDDYRDPENPIKALILRLDGTVDLVAYRAGHRLELLTK